MIIVIEYKGRIIKKYFKTFKIPIHSIYSLGQVLPTTFKVDINV